MRSNQHRGQRACKRGHALVAGNVYVYRDLRGGLERHCRACRRARHYAARKKARMSP